MRSREESGVRLGDRGQPESYVTCLAAGEGMRLEKRFLLENRAERQLDSSPQLQPAGLSAKLAGFLALSIETDTEINQPSSGLEKDSTSGELSQDLFEAQNV